MQFHSSIAVNHYIIPYFCNIPNQAPGATASLCSPTLAIGCLSGDKYKNVCSYSMIKSHKDSLVKWQFSQVKHRVFLNIKKTH